ncbi:MAG: ferritin-like domain-containing protein [Actinomycetota bacterium]|nr:ferritin-like domain-containing protein [Actinomycetota bacterium]
MANTQIFDGKPVIEFDNESDRRNFIKWAGIVGVGSTLVAGGLGRQWASAQEGSDIDILNYALTLEYLEADFYTRGLDANILSGRDQALVVPIKAHEQAHVSTLSQTITDLGGKPVKKPGFKYPGPTFKSKDDFLSTASVFEELGVTAYHGQVTKIKNPDLLAAAASIAGVESRHAAILADLTGKNPFPGPVEKTATMATVLEAAKPFLK